MEVSREFFDIFEGQTKWPELTMKDEEFGGSNFPENLAIARELILDFGTPELRELLQITCLGDHPEIIRLLVRIGKAAKYENQGLKIVQ
jgi:hypothetical protein